MIHTLIFTPRYPPYSGGSAIYFSNLVENVNKENRSYYILTKYHPDTDIISTTREGVTIVRAIPYLDNLPIGPFKPLVESAASFISSFIMILICNITTIHCHSSSYATPGVILASKFSRRGLLLDFRDLYFPEVMVKYISADLYFSCAEEIDCILTENGVSDSDIIRIPIMNPDYVSEYRDIEGHPEEATRIIYVGRLIREKGVPNLIKAFERFNEINPDSELLLVGDDPNGNASQMVNNSKAKGQISMFGEISHRDALEKISTCDLLVNPSPSETGPRSVLEAIELGTPVVTTDVGYAGEIVRDTQVGVISDGSVDDLNNSIIAAVNSSNIKENVEKGAPATRSWTDVSKVVSKAYKQSDGL